MPQSHHGTYTSHLLVDTLGICCPPETRTFQEFNRVATAQNAPVHMLAVIENEPVEESYSSVRAEELPPPEIPLTTKTFPLARSTAEWLYLGVLISPLEAKVPVNGS